VLVGRWTLLSEAADAAPSDDPDAGTRGVNEQFLHAQRARDRARARETAPSSDGDGHSSNEKNH
jgi:hypothetical protein